MALYFMQRLFKELLRLLFSFSLAQTKTIKYLDQESKLITLYNLIIIRLEGEFKGINLLRGYKRGKTLVQFKDGTEI